MYTGGTNDELQQKSRAFIKIPKKKSSSYIPQNETFKNIIWNLFQTILLNHFAISISWLNLHPDACIICYVFLCSVYIVSRKRCAFEMFSNSTVSHQRWPVSVASTQGTSTHLTLMLLASGAQVQRNRKEMNRLRSRYKRSSIQEEINVFCVLIAISNGIYWTCFWFCQIVAQHRNYGMDKSLNSCKIWDVITHSILTSLSVESKKWMSDCISYKTIAAITYACPNLKGPYINMV